MQWYLVILIWSYLNSSYQTSLVAQMVKCLPAMRETWVRSLGREDPMEKKMATHPSTLAWKIPWTKEPDRLQSMGLQRFGYGWATSLSLNSSRCWASFHFLFAIVMCLLALLLFFAKESVQFCSFLSLSFLLVCKSLYMCVCVLSRSVMCDFLQFHGPSRFLSPWDFQERILDWVAISFFRGSSWPRDRTHLFCVYCIGRGILYHLCHLGSPRVFT